MDKNKIARKSRKQAFTEEYHNLGGRGDRLLRPLSEKYIALIGKIPCPLLLGGWFCRDAGSGKLICQVNIEFSSEKNPPPSSRRVLVTPLHNAAY